MGQDNRGDQGDQFCHSKTNWRIFDDLMLPKVDHILSTFGTYMLLLTVVSVRPLIAVRSIYSVMSIAHHCFRRRTVKHGYRGIQNRTHLAGFRIDFSSYWHSSMHAKISILKRKSPFSSWITLSSAFDDTMSTDHYLSIQCLGDRFLRKFSH